KVFGATETVRMNGPDGKVGHAELKIGNSHIMLADENPTLGQGHTSAATIGASPVSLYVYLPDVDRVIEKAAAEGAKIRKPVQDHVHGAGNPKRVLKISLGVTFAYIVLLVVAGIRSHSLALLSEAGHNLSDFLALLLSLVAVYLQSRPASATKTYGYPRAGVLA